MGVTQHLPHKDGVNIKCVDSYKALGVMPGAWQVGIVVVFKKVCFLQHRNLTQIALPRKVSQRQCRSPFWGPPLACWSNSRVHLLCPSLMSHHVPLGSCKGQTLRWSQEDRKVIGTNLWGREEGRTGTGHESLSTAKQLRRGPGHQAGGVPVLGRSVQSPASSVRPLSGAALCSLPEAKMESEVAKGRGIAAHSTLA